MRENDFSGKVGLITGGGMGIGRSCALQLAERGAAVIIFDIDEAAARAVAAEIEAAGGSATAVRVDVCDAEAVDAAVDGVVETFSKLDFAINNAGVVAQPSALADVSDSEWARIITINLTGVFHCMRRELVHMVQAGRGAIVNTASTAGLTVAPKMPAYVASKHGVVGLTKAAALDYGDTGIRINALCPGTTQTPMFAAAAAERAGHLESRRGQTWLGRLAEPDEIAAGAVWLCSEAASYVTGTTLAINGGRIG
jgi:NAD(P)-dependent dehydrogenase (short-subunit alcohol dehydrogenase family)